MRSALAILAMILFGSACATDDEPVDTPVVSTLDVPAIDDADAIDLQDEDSPDDICGRLPPDGPCSLACDEEALADQYVPAGACAAFSCTLTDGTKIAVHACHISD